MAEWKEYTGSDEQITEMRDAKDGFIAKNVSSISNVMRVKLNQLFISDQKSPYLPELFGNKIESFLSYNNTTHYLICEPHQRADMICQQARTGQPVWVRYEWRDSTGPNTETFVTNTPDWNIPNAEYRFSPFEDYATKL